MKSTIEEIDLQVAEIEASSSDVRVRLKAQDPDDQAAIVLGPPTDPFLKLAQEAKKRGGTVWLRFKVAGNKLEDGRLIVRDQVE
jgi:hypothetical protein